MKLAIIGGGAAGMVAAYLLHRTHHVTVLEKQPFLGGNIRTLNKNLPSPVIDAGLAIDNGVIEFQKDHNPVFNRLMGELGVVLEGIDAGSSGIYLENGSFRQSPGTIKVSYSQHYARLKAHLKLIPLLKDYLPVRWQMRPANAHRYQNQPISAFFSDRLVFRWLKMLLMYGYSTPYDQIDQFPAEIAFPILLKSDFKTRWNRVVGGVYSYIEAILARMAGRASIRCGVDIDSITRSEQGVVVTLKSGEALPFDKLIFATTPDQVLKLLADPSEAEKKRFAAWKPNTARTVLHTDTGIYRPYQQSYFTEFDVFEKDRGRDAGYNAFLNRLCGLPPDHPIKYNLAFNMNDRIAPEKILDTQIHHTPLYTTEALRYRRQVKATNGENHTYHAGAYLGDGLHEGAVRSAVVVAALLGGKTL